MKLGLLIFVAAAFALQLPLEYRPLPFPYKDEATSDSSLRIFRQNLVRIIERRSVDALMSVIEGGAPIEVRNARPENFRRDFEEFGETRWRQLQRAITLGGAFTSTRGAKPGRREFCAPYVYAAFPDRLPPFIGALEQPWVLAADSINVRGAPSAGAPVVARLSRVIVEVISERDVASLVEPSEFGWVNVAMSPSRFGWVSQQYARSPSDWHVCMTKLEDEWKISEFVKWDPTAVRSR